MHTISWDGIVPIKLSKEYVIVETDITEEMGIAIKIHEKD